MFGISVIFIYQIRLHACYSNCDYLRKYKNKNTKIVQENDAHKVKGCRKKCFVLVSKICEKRLVLKRFAFPYRESSPGRLGEKQES